MDKNIILVVALFAAIWLGMNFLFKDKKENTPLPSQNTRQQEPAQPPDKHTEKIIEQEKTRAASVVTLENKTRNVRVKLTERGAALLSASLLDFKSRENPDEPLKLLKDFIPGRRSMVLAHAQANRYRLNQRLWKLTQSDTDSAVFTITVDNIKINKTFSFEKNGDLRLDITFESLEDVKLFPYQLLAIDGINPDHDPETPRSFYSDPVTAILSVAMPNSEKDFEKFTPKDVLDKPDALHTEDERNVFLVGAMTRYFAALVVPKQSYPDGRQFRNDLDSVKIFIRQKKTEKPDKEIDEEKQEHFGILFQSRTLTLQPKMPLTHTYWLVTGTRDKLMDREGMGGLSYTWWMKISRVLMTMLFYIEKAVFNWGFAIILLTLIIRLCLHPVSLKQQRSMLKMKDIQPKLQTLKEKYKNRPQEFSKKQLELFKKEGVNPIGSCLPLLIQLPIFISMYMGIRYDIHLRMASFILWIKDLSTPDALLELPFTVPFLGWGALNILPIIMTIVWVLQARSMPQSEDPQQKQMQTMMKFMPIAFGFMMYNAPSGLTLYWTTNTLLAMLETKYIKNKLAHQKAQGKL